MLNNPRLSGEEWNALENAVNVLEEKILYPKYEKLNKICRELGIYPDSQYPGVCWILEEVLGIDPTQVLVDECALARGLYTTLAKNEYGGPLFDDRYGLVRQKHILDAKQMAALHPWLEYVPERVKYGNR